MPFTDFVDRHDDEPGISIDQLAAAVSVWAWMQESDKPQTVAAAALAFNTTPQFIRDAIEIHPWAFLTGHNGEWSEIDPTKQFIEHDGE